MNARNRLPGLSICLLLLTSAAIAQSRATRLAVLDFGKDPSGLRAAAAIRETLQSGGNAPNGREFTVIDRDQATAAALGAGFDGLLNLTPQQARDARTRKAAAFY